MIKLPVHRQWFGLSEPERQGTDWISFVVSGRVQQVPIL